MLRDAMAQLTATPAVQPPVNQPFSKGQAFAAALLAGLQAGGVSPGAYTGIVLPELERRQQAERLALGQQAEAENARFQRGMAVAQLQSTLNEREATRAYRDEELRLRQAADARARADQEIQEGKEQQERDAVLAGFDEGSATFQTIVPAVKGAFDTLTASGDPFDAAQAKVIAAKYEALGERMKRAHANRETLTRADLDDLKDDFRSLQDDLQKQLDRGQSAAAARTGQAIQVRGQDLADIRAARDDAKATALKPIEGVAKTELTEGLQGSRQMAGVRSLFDGVKDEFGRFTAWNPFRSKKFKDFTAAIQSARAPIMKALIGAGQTESEAARNYALMADAGNGFSGDPESVESAMSAIEGMIAQGIKARIDTEADSGRDVTQQRVRFEREILPKLSPTALSQILDMPEEVPPGSVLMQFAPNKRVYQTPEGRLMEWTPDPEDGGPLQLGTPAEVRAQIVKMANAGKSDREILASLVDAGFDEESIAGLIAGIQEGR